MDIMILACGKMKKDSLSEAINHYQKQMHTPLSLKEIHISNPDPLVKKREENKALRNMLLPTAHIIALDETGKDYTSREIAKLIDTQQRNTTKHLQIIIGGADGLEKETLDKANIILRFGHQTWPHKLVRLMLFEQLYRAQSILNNHPYHRD